MMTTRASPLLLLFLSLGLAAQEPGQEAAAETAAEPPATDAGMPVAEPAAQPPDLFARDTYRIDTLVCPFKGEIEYEPGDIECGLLEVPENREDPDSRFIELHFVKLN